MIGKLLIILTLGIALSACAAPANQNNLPDTEKPGRKLYYAKCAKCHKFYNPANYSDEEWNMWMGKMKKKAKLSDEQQAQLSLYINANLRGSRKK
jgi:hypothetical protein